MNGNSRVDRRFLLLGEGLLLLCLLALCVFLLYSPRERASLVFDPLVYAVQSINLAHGEGNTITSEGEAYHGYYPAGYPLLIVPVHWVAGVHLQNGVIVNFVLGLFILLCVYLLGRRVAGPLAGGTAVVLLIKLDIFRFIAHQAIAEMSGVAASALMTLCVFAGWRGEGRSGGFRLLAGLVGGLAVVLRYANFGVPVALGVFAVVVPASRTSRWRTALPTWIGIGVAALLTLMHNQICYGGLLDSGYSRLGGSVLPAFSLKFILDPPVMQIDQDPWPILRASLGFGHLHPWPMALAALLGAVYAWTCRGEWRRPWILTLMTVTVMVLEGAFLSLYFFRTPLYLTLYLPPLVILAGALPTRFLHRVLAHRGRALSWVPALPLLLALAYLVPELSQAPVLKEDDGGKGTERVRVFRALDAALEENAVLVGATNPVLGQYVFASRGRRIFYFLDDLVGGLQGMPPKDRETGEVLEEMDGFITRMQGESRPVYILTLPPTDPSETWICQEIYQFLQDRFQLIATPVFGIAKVGERR